MKTAFLAAAALSAITATASHATVTVYTDRAAFEAAAKANGQNIQTESFSGAATGDFNPTGSTFSQAFDGFKVTGENNGNYVGIATGPTSDFGPDQPVPTSFADGSNKYLQWANGNSGGKSRDSAIVSITLNLNAATTAFGFDWFNTDVTDQYTLTLPGVSTPYSAPPFTVANQGGTTSGFFGLISDTAFTTATITNNFFGGYISDEGFDNLTTNGVGSSNPPPPTGAVPEPATWAMMIGGIGLAGGALRRSRTALGRVAYA